MSGWTFTSEAHNDPDLLPYLMEEPTVIIFHMSWASRHRLKSNIPLMFMGEPTSAETGKYHPETTEITFSRDNGRDSSLRSIFSRT
jgi:hypothetical protein